MGDMDSISTRFGQFGRPILGLANNQRFVIRDITLQGVNPMRAEIVEVMYTDTQAEADAVHSSVRTHRPGIRTQSYVDRSSALYHHLVAAFCYDLIPAEGLGCGVSTILKSFEQRTRGIILQPAILRIDGQKVACRKGVLGSFSIAEVIVLNRVATLVGPDEILSEPMTKRARLTSAIVPP